MVRLSHGEGEAGDDAPPLLIPLDLIGTYEFGSAILRIQC